LTTIEEPYSTPPDPEKALGNLLILISKYGPNPLSSSFESVLQETEYWNACADYWRYYVGVNTIPANTRKKVTYEPWSEYQSSPISEEQYKEWKIKGAFNNGIAIILGKVWHNKQRFGLYLNGIDLDNRKAIEEVCKRNGKTISISNLAQWTLVEQHPDDPTKLHIYVYSHKPFAKKSSDKTRTYGDLTSKLKINEIPALEVKGEGSHGIFFCFPSFHMNGNRYQIIDNKDPVIADDFEKHIDNICQKYGLKYLDNSDSDSRSRPGLIPINELFKEDAIIHAGHNRHEALLRVMESLLKRNAGILSIEQIMQDASDWNAIHCNPPLNDREFQKQWKCATKFIAIKNPDIVANNRNSVRSGSNSSLLLSPKNDQGLHSVGHTEDNNNTDLSLVDKLESSYIFKTMKDTREIYYYHEKYGIFVNGGENLLECKSESLKPHISTYQVNEIKNHIRRRTLTDRPAFDSKIEWLALKDCMINLKTLETKPHSPEFMTTVRIPICHKNKDNLMYDFFEWVNDPIETPSCPRILKFMHEVMAPEDVETVLDFIAYCLWRGLPFHKYLLLNGSGRNGKGSLLRIIRCFLGSQNVSSESLHRLLENRFATAQLYGKLANIDADLSKESLKNTGLLKKLTGGDAISAEKKFMPPFTFVNYAKLIFSANEIPQTNDETDAFFSRLIIVNFPHQFLGEKSDPYLLDKLTTEDELSGLLKVVLKRLPRVLEKGIHTESSSIDQNYEKYILSSNPVRAFVENCLEQDSNSNPSKEKMYFAYKGFCIANKLPIESEQSFSRKMTKDGFQCKQIRDSKGNKPYFWIGVRIKEAL
jgi:P4 family phage/plasmid primase-like protien